MARGNEYGLWPIDVPCIESQELKYKENSAPGDDRWLALEPEDPARHAKGDLGMRTLPEPRPLTGGLPFKNLKGDK